MKIRSPHRRGCALVVPAWLAAGLCALAAAAPSAVGEDAQAGNDGGRSIGSMPGVDERSPELPAGSTFSAEYEVTDASLGQVVGDSPNPETTNMARVGDYLCFVYRVNNATTIDQVFVRRFDLRTNQFQAPMLVESITEEATLGYHSEPSLLRDGSGALHAYSGFFSQIGACLGTFQMAPRYRVLVNAGSATAGGWTAAACLPSRITNTTGALLDDIMGVYDDRTGVTHLVGQGDAIGPIDGVSHSGQPRIYYRILPNGTYDGPYLLVQAASGQPSGPGYGGGGSIYTKGDLAMGTERSGPRSLHLIWNIRDYWTDSNGTHQWNYNLYYARSFDGGATWQPADGSVSVGLTQHIQWNDARFLAYEGDVDQNSERALGVDPGSNPVFLVVAYKKNTGVNYGPHVDVLATPRPEYTLICRRWSGQRWEQFTVDATANFSSSRPRIRVDDHGGIWVFTGEIPLGGSRPRCRYSSDFGRPWSAWTLFGGTQSRAQRLYSYADPLDSRFHYVAYSEPNSMRLKFVRVRLSP